MDEARQEKSQFQTIKKSGMAGSFWELYAPTNLWTAREAFVWHNEEQRELAGVPYIADIISSNRLRRAVHIAMKGEETLPTVVFGDSPETVSNRV